MVQYVVHYMMHYLVHYCECRPASSALLVHYKCITSALHGALHGAVHSALHGAYILQVTGQLASLFHDGAMLRRVSSDVGSGACVAGWAGLPFAGSSRDFMCT